MTRSVTLDEFLTDEQLEKCLVLYPDVYAIRREVIEPSMTEINRKLGQENDARFLAYMVIFAISQAARLKGAS